MLLIEYPKCSTCQKAKVAGRQRVRYMRTGTLWSRTHGWGAGPLVQKRGSLPLGIFNTSGFEAYNPGLKDKLADMSEEGAVKSC